MPTKELWGHLGGDEIYLITLKNKHGMTVRLTSYGAAIVGIDVPDRHGAFADVVLGYDDFAGYLRGESCQGATVGRYANRIAGGSFTLDGKTYQLPKNDGTNCLHGGFTGFNKRAWAVHAVQEDGVTFAYQSPDGEEGFPGALDVRLTYTLTEENALRLSYHAVSDKDTVINLTNHAYFNLAGYGHGSVHDTILQIHAEDYTPVNASLIPCQGLSPVKNTDFDFTAPKRIGDGGYDHNFAAGKSGVMKTIATAKDPASGRVLTVRTDKPGVQLYTANSMDETFKGGVRLGRHSAFCLETQFYPDTPNQPEFPGCVFRAGEAYDFTTTYAFSVEVN